MAAEAQPKRKIVEHPELDPSTGFDYRTHIKDAKTGQLIRLQNYARHSKNGEVLLERPIGSGNCFFENGEPAGRYRFTQTKTDVTWEKISDTHLEVKPMLSKVDELKQTNELLSLEVESLRAEADALRKKAQGQK